VGQSLLNSITLAFYRRERRGRKGQRSEDGGRKAEDGGRRGKTEVRCPMSVAPGEAWSVGIGGERAALEIR